MAKINIRDEIKIPEDVEISLEPPLVHVKGPKGELEKRMHHPSVHILKNQDKLIFEIKNATKKEKMLMKTFEAHIKNMIKGVREGYTYKLKICSGHFPMNVKQEQNKIIISNFLGEKVPREATIPENVSVEIKKDDIVLTGIDKELVGQAAANIERATRITNRDRRRFQDGIYLVEKDGVPI
jgi:large subunit ribosomal protein L6